MAPGAAASSSRSLAAFGAAGGAEKGQSQLGCSMGTCTQKLMLYFAESLLMVPCQGLQIIGSAVSRARTHVSSCRACRGCRRDPWFRLSGLLTHYKISLGKFYCLPRKFKFSKTMTILSNVLSAGCSALKLLQKKHRDKGQSVLGLPQDAVSTMGMLGELGTPNPGGTSCSKPSKNLTQQESGSALWEAEDLCVWSCSALPMLQTQGKVEL